MPGIEIGSEERKRVSAVDCAPTVRLTLCFINVFFLILRQPHTPPLPPLENKNTPLSCLSQTENAR